MVLELAAAVFLALHGLVHLWYVVLSNGWIEVEDAMGWNGESWLLTGVLPEGIVLAVASVLYVLVTLLFLVGAVGFLRDAGWAMQVLLAAATLSTLVLVVMWDGRFDLLVEKGGRRRPHQRRHRRRDLAVLTGRRVRVIATTDRHAVLTSRSGSQARRLDDARVSTPGL